MENLDKRLIGIIVAVLIVTFAVGNWYAQRTNDKTAIQDELIIINEDITQESEGDKPVDIVVFVSGAVVNPGIYTLADGARVYEAIDKAGGLLDEAEFKHIQMARIIEDEETIYIPMVGENEESGAVIAGQSLDKSSAKININKATAKELETLNGIGPALAERIINYRNTNGAFTDITDIKKVSGIGDKKFESIKDSISVK